MGRYLNLLPFSHSCFTLKSIWHHTKAAANETYTPHSRGYFRSLFCVRRMECNEFSQYIIKDTYRNTSNDADHYPDSTTRRLDSA